MNVNEQSNLLSREEAWWFIHKDHVTPLRILEDKLNDLVYSNDVLSRETALEMLRNNLASNKDKEQAEKILEHFIRYYENSNNVLAVNEDGSLSLRIKCELVGTYTDDYAHARIILERILKNRTECVGKAFIHSAMKDLIDPEYVPGKEEHRYKTDQLYIEKDLEKKYKDKFKVAITLLLKAKLVELESDLEKKKKAQQEDGRKRNAYRLAQTFLDSIPHENVEQVLYNRAIQKLRSIHLKAKSKGNTVTKKKEIKRILEAKEYITTQLNNISIGNSSDRTVFHWFCVFLIMKYAHVDTSRVLDDIITYIRYNNIKVTPIPVTENKLSQWEEGYACWSAFEKLLLRETSLPTINWELSIYEDDYVDASSRLINDITEVLSSFDSHIKNVTRENVVVDASLIEWMEEIRFSLLYVRATIELNSSHSDALGHLENLFKIISQNKSSKNYYDLCLVVSKLSRLACEDSFEYSSKARKWIYVFNNIPECADSFDVQNVLANIYLHLIGMAGDESLSDRYRQKCSQLIKNITVSHGNVNQLLELTTQKYLYLLYTIDSLNFKEASEWILDLWKNVMELFTIANTKDPRPNILKYETFIIAANLLNKYLNFGFSLSLLTVNAILHLKSIGVKSYINYYHLLEGLGNFIEPYEPDVALRVKMQIEPDYPNKLYIDREIAIQLFDKGCFDIAFDYVKKAEENFNYHNLNDIESVVYYIDVLLSQINALFLLGNENKAIDILSDCGNKLSELYDLYPEKERSCILQGVIDHYHNIKSVLEKRPFYSRELRLDYVLTAIGHMDAKSTEIEDFFYKWKLFNGMYMFHIESIDKDLQEEFESDKFAATIEDIASRVVFSSPEFDLSPIRDEEITLLKNNLEESYELYQRSFLLYNDDDIIVDPELPIETPTYERLFELFKPDTGCTVFAEQQKTHAAGKSVTNENASAEELEKYHYVVMSDSSSADDALVAADMFMKRIEFAVETTYIKEMAAEVLCEQSILIDYDNWDEKERLLNMAESYIVEKKGTFLSDKAKEIYIRIAHRLCDVYDYRSREGASSDYSKYALDTVRRYNIRTVDSAWFIGEHAERLMYEAKSQGNTNLLSEAKNLFSEAIEILQSVNPQTDDNRHYIELYTEFLTQL